MAVEKYNFLNENSLLRLSKDIFTKVNIRIADAIIKTAVSDADYENDKKALSAKSVLTLIGKTTDEANADGSIYARIAAVKATADAAATADTINGLLGEVDSTDVNTINGRINKNATDIGTANTAIGAATDEAAADGSIYARIAAVKATADTAAGDVNTLKSSVGAVDDAAAADGSIYARIKKNGENIGALNMSVGKSTDVANVDGSLYARLAALKAEISGLNNLRYEVFTGPITNITAPDSDVLYLQHDEPSLAVNNAGYLVDTDGNPATAGGYYGWVDPNTGKIYKATDTSSHTNTELASGDALLAEGGPVARVEDTTYNLYVATNISGSTCDWVCVGDTEIALSNYLDKSDASVAELQARILEPIPDATITSIVDEAFSATQPV